MNVKDVNDIPIISREKQEIKKMWWNSIRIKVIGAFTIIMLLPISFALFFFLNLIQTNEDDKIIGDLKTAIRMLKGSISHDAHELEIAKKLISKDDKINDISIPRNSTEEEKINNEKIINNIIHKNNIDLFILFTEEKVNNETSPSTWNPIQLSPTNSYDFQKSIFYLLQKRAQIEPTRKNSIDIIMSDHGITTTRIIPIYNINERKKVMAIIGRTFDQNKINLLKSSIGNQELSIIQIINTKNYKFKTILSTHHKCDQEHVTDNYKNIIKIKNTQNKENIELTQRINFHNKDTWEHLEAMVINHNDSRIIVPGIFRALSVNSYPSLNDSYEQFKAYLLVLASIALGLTILAAYALSRQIIAPIQRLAQQFSSLSRRIKEGKPLLPIYLRRRDEIGDLSLSFNAMASNLHKAYNDIQDYSSNLEERIIERTHKLREINKKLSEASDEIKKELHVASTVQKAILPASLPQDKNFTVAAQTLAMMSDVSGDYYDVFNFGDGLYGILIADVSGHGVPAALITMMSKAAFGNIARNHTDPCDVCSIVNKELTDTLSDIGFYLTAFYIIINTEKLTATFTNAGHPRAIVHNRSTGNVRFLDKSGFFIGSFPEAKYESNATKLEKHERIILVSDGIIEARNKSGDFFTEERLIRVIKESPLLSAQETVNAIIHDVRLFLNKKRQNDDQTIIVMDMKN